jgi:hypothetical protein
MFNRQAYTGVQYYSTLGAFLDLIRLADFTRISSRFTNSYKLAPQYYYELLNTQYSGRRDKVLFIFVV